MHVFRVWAPLPKQVAVLVNGVGHPMASTADGWWVAEVASAHPGSDYGFMLDGEGPFPDPRSAYQPSGVHGLSRLVDPAAFKWTDDSWQARPLSAAIVYELHVGTFTPQGTFTSAIEKLDHLVKLGVTHVELMPVNEFPGNRGWGYDGAALFAPFHAYGGPDELKRLVDACHARKLAVLLDVVYNHLGPSGNYLPRFAPCFTDRHSSFWGKGINFDGPDSDGVRRFFCDNALMWLRDYHFDGLRLDAVHAIVDTSAETFLEQLGREVKELEARLGRHLVLIAESDLNDPRLLWPHERGGFALDAQWNDDYHHALHALLTGEQTGYYSDYGALGDFARIQREVFLAAGEYSPFRRRRHGRPPEGLGGERFLAYFQNHDQVGNRARGDRGGHLLSPGLAKIAAALVFTSPFVPMLFQGEEWGAATPFLYFTDYSEPDLARNVRDSRCREFAAFGWKPEEVPDPQDRKTFQRSRLDWSELAQEPHQEMLAWHQQLVQLRRMESALSNGRRDRVRTAHNEQDRWLVIERGPIQVACNLADKPQVISLGEGDHRLLLASTALPDKICNRLLLPAESVAIVKNSPLAPEC